MAERDGLRDNNQDGRESRGQLATAFPVNPFCPLELQHFCRLSPS
jgi:hypothetical protein